MSVGISTIQARYTASKLETKINSFDSIVKKTIHI